MDDLQAQFRQQIDEYLMTIQNKVEELFKEAIQESIYDYYTPIPEEHGGYHRNYTFLNSVTAHIDMKSGIMYVYSDLNEGSQYYSAVDGSPQFQNIGHWMESGHSDNTGYGGQYHQFEGRNYLERAKELINQEFPDLQIQILDNEDI